MKTRFISGIVFSISVVATVVVFQNCSKSNLKWTDFEQQEGSESASVSSMLKDCIPSTQSKATSLEQVKKVPSDFETMVIGPESALLAVIDNQCAEESSSSPMRDIVLRNKSLSKNLRISSYAFSPIAPIHFPS